MPEHVPGLMSLLAGGPARLVDDHLVIVGEVALVVVGYPLEGTFDTGRARDVARRAVRDHRRPELRFIGPRIPPDLPGEEVACESDRYLELDPGRPAPSRSERRAARARERLTVRREEAFGAEHAGLVDAIRARTTLPLRVEALYAAIPDVVERSATTELLAARTHDGTLAAWFAVERAARRFDAYLLGAHSREPEAAHASDLLMSETIRAAREAGKPAVALGLAVNPGIRRFKTKWGAREGPLYEATIRRLRRPGWLEALRMLRGGPS